MFIKILILVLILLTGRGYAWTSAYKNTTAGAYTWPNGINVLDSGIFNTNNFAADPFVPGPATQWNFGTRQLLKELTSFSGSYKVICRYNTPTPSV